MNTTKQTTPLVTYETVAQACQALDAEGKRPSVRGIIAYLGGGSPNVVLDYQRQWKEGRPVVRAEEIQVDPRIGQIVADQISQAVTKARSDIEAQLIEAEQDAETVGKAGREAEEKAKALDAELEVAKGQLQTLSGQIDQLKADAEQVKADAAEQIKAAEDRAVAGITKAEEEAERESQAREAAQVSLAKAELRLEALPRLESEIERLQKALDAERTARTDAERMVAAADAKAEGLTARLAALPRLEAEIDKLQKTLDAERTMRTDAERKVAATEAKADGLTTRLSETQEQLHQVQAQAQEQTKRANEAFVATAGQIGKLEGTIAAQEKKLADADLAAQMMQSKLDSLKQELDYTKQRHQQPEEAVKPKTAKKTGGE